MLKRLNAVNLLGALCFLAMLATAGFTEGGNYLAACLSAAVFAGSAYLACREDGGTKK